MEVSGQAVWDMKRLSRRLLTGGYVDSNSLFCSLFLNIFPPITYVNNKETNQKERERVREKKSDGQK